MKINTLLLVYLLSSFPKAFAAPSLEVRYLYQISQGASLTVTNDFLLPANTVQVLVAEEYQSATLKRSCNLQYITSNKTKILERGFLLKVKAIKEEKFGATIVEFKHPIIKSLTCSSLNAGIYSGMIELNVARELIREKFLIEDIFFQAIPTAKEKVCN